MNIQLTNCHLTLVHRTTDGYRTTLVVPTDPFSQHALERVEYPAGHVIYEDTPPIPTGCLSSHIEALANSKRMAS